MSLSFKGRVFKKIRSPSGQVQLHQDLSGENILVLESCFKKCKKTINRSNNFKKIGKMKPVYGLIMDWYVLFDFINNF